VNKVVQLLITIHSMA